MRIADSYRAQVVALAVVLALCMFSVQPAQCAQDDAITWMWVDRSTLTVSVDLASDTPSDQVNRRNDVLGRLYNEIETAKAERFLALQPFYPTPGSNFTGLVAVGSERSLDYLVAMRQSYAHFRGATAAADLEWMAKHWTATKKYAALAAQGLIAQAKLDEDTAATLQTVRFALRRPPDQAALYVERLKREGLGTEHRKFLQESGLDPEEINAYEKALQATPPSELGVSIVELYTDVAQFRRTLATSLEEFAGSRSMESAPLSQTYLVGNPHDREETVDLVIRRASVPPGWKLSIADAEPASGGKPEKRVQEVEAGQHYRVQLPAQGQLTVVSVVVPVGVVGENTLVRWADEGRIGDELIGGIVHEMYVPGFIADLKLPPIAPAAAGTTGPASERSRWVMPASIAVGSLFVIAALVLLLSRRRRRA